jgi:glycosyltransferase involved in cell wall biosynthesis
MHVCSLCYCLLLGSYLARLVLLQKSIDFVLPLDEVNDLERRFKDMYTARSKTLYPYSLDIFLMTSIRETFGLVMLEAIQYAKPVITTNTDGANTIFDQKSALFVDFNKPIALQFTQHIISLIENENLLESVVLHSKNRLYNRFSFNCLQENLNSIIEKLYRL